MEAASKLGTSIPRLTLDLVFQLPVRESGPALLSGVHSSPFRSHAKNGNNRFRVPGCERGEPRFPFLSSKNWFPFARCKKNDSPFPPPPSIAANKIIHRFSRVHSYFPAPLSAREEGVATIGRTGGRGEDQASSKPDWERQSALRLRRVHIPASSLDRSPSPGPLT